MRLAHILAALTCVALTACTGLDTQIPLPEAQSDLRVRPVVSSFEVRDVSLPRYAAADEIVVRNEEGGLDAISGNLWADTPTRASTNKLADALATITGSRVAAEPWPFAEPPAAQVQVRVTQMHGDASGVFRLKGQYIVAPVSSGLSDRSGRFDIGVPLASDAPSDVAAAHAQAWVELAETIARRIGR